MKKKICIIGMGNMGQAMLEIASAIPDYQLVGISKDSDLNSNLEDCDAFIVAVKPQDFQDLAKMIRVKIEDKVVVSIMAGVSIGNIQNTLGVRKVIRVMPNLPMKIGRALCGWYADPSIAPTDKDIVKKILNELGDEIEVKSEEKIDAITALSGSGPAYFYFVAEILQEAAMEMGFSSEGARKIAEATLIGAGELLEHSEITAEVLRKQITSKGGTTEAAIETFEQEGLRKVLKSGIMAAYRRAEDLNK